MRKLLILFGIVGVASLGAVACDAPTDTPVAAVDLLELQWRDVPLVLVFSRARLLQRV